MLDGKIAMVTGAASGIGRASAEQLLGAAARVLFCNKDADKLAAIALQLGVDAITLVVDFVSAQQLWELPGRTLDLCGQIDIVHANAGLYVGGAVVGGDCDAWDRMLLLNINSVFRLVKEILPHKVQRKTGEIIVTSSIAGHIVIPWEPVFSASKHAVQAFVHGLRRQVLQDGIRVGEISPGIAITPLLDSWTPENRAALLEGKCGLPPEEIAEATLFMLTRLRNVTIRNLAILPQNQDI